MLKKQSILTFITQGLVALMLGVAISACTPMPTRRDAPEYVDDAALATRVKAELAKSSVSNAADVEVEAYRGVVQLSGFVDSPEAAQKAVNAAERIDGVKSVKNDMRIKPAR